jgi:hypothetical protein
MLQSLSKMASPFIADSGYGTESASVSRRTSMAEQGGVTPVEPTSILNGHKLVPVQKFKNLKSLRDVIVTEREKLKQAGSPLKFMVFRLMKPDVFEKLRSSDEGAGPGTRYGYDHEKEHIIITVFPKQLHEVFVANICRKVERQLEGMGIDEQQFFDIATADYEGARGVKQPDTSYKPVTREGETAPPSLVFEAGYTESLPQLRRDAEWWLSNAPHQVNIVVLVAIRPTTRVVVIEKWTLIDRTKDGQSGTRSRPAPVFTLPTMTTEITIQPETKGSTTFVVKGAPLILEFKKLMDRDPLSPETDITVIDSELAKAAAAIWKNMKPDE